MEFNNQAGWDRLTRVGVGLFMIVAGWFVLGDGLWGAAFKIFGLIPLATGLLGWCPFYAVLGVTTKHASRSR